MDHHTTLAEDADSTGYVRYGGAIVDPARSGDRWWTIALPKELEPGRYRIAKDVLLGEENARTVAYSEELVVTA